MQSITRREFGKSAIAVTASAGVMGTMALEGCNASAWISTILQDIPVVLQVITSILGVVSAAGSSVAAAITTEVNQYGMLAQAALQEAQVLVGQYNAAVGSDRPGLLGKIHTALVTAQNNLNQILSVFQVSDQNLDAAILGGLGAAITVVVAVEALVPLPPAASTVQTKLATHDEREVIKAAYNAIVAKRFPRAAV